MTEETASNDPGVAVFRAAEAAAKRGWPQTLAVMQTIAGSTMTLTVGGGASDAMRAALCEEFGDLFVALADLGNAVLGLVVRHRGRDMQLHKTSSGWWASTESEATEHAPAERHISNAFDYGDTLADITKALDACADAADAYEGDGAVPCTGITARSCPNCGECKCRPPTGLAGDMDEPDCPLHALNSTHGEEVDDG